MQHTRGIETEEDCLAAWAALPWPARGDDFLRYKSLSQLARRRGWVMPERRRGRPPLPPKRAQPSYAEWLEAWEALPVPIPYEERAPYQQLRRIALRMGYTMPPRPNPGHVDRERDHLGRLKSTY